MHTVPDSAPARKPYPIKCFCSHNHKNGDFRAISVTERSVTYRIVVHTLPARKATRYSGTDQFRFLGNYPPTPPLNHHFVLSEK